MLPPWNLNAWQELISGSDMGLREEVAGLRPWLRTLARKYYTDKMDIEDLVSETICKTLSNCDKYDGKRALKPWMEAIMQNTYITSYNRDKVVQFVRTDTSNSAMSGEDTGSSVLLRDIMEAIERCGKRSCCVDSFLRYVEGYSYDEISKMYKIPVGTVRSRISTARTMIRNELDFKG